MKIINVANLKLNVSYTCLKYQSLKALNSLSLIKVLGGHTVVYGCNDSNKTDGCVDFLNVTTTCLCSTHLCNNQVKIGLDPTLTGFECMILLLLSII